MPPSASRPPQITRLNSNNNNNNSNKTTKQQQEQQQEQQQQQQERKRGKSLIQSLILKPRTTTHWRRSPLKPTDGQVRKSESGPEAEAKVHTSEKSNNNNIDNNNNNKNNNDNKDNKNNNNTRQGR
ncbi:unnamed protein product [Polarella glacialis]|uniref:Uncharacterized protein n=1 Tax=Polarella glacialis TaxID=89957 RepID=A0A813DH95_POLGL|nr:unnamed protein product [Polarella glacialis]